MRWTVAHGEHYERNVTEVLRRLVELLQGPVFYDAGASYGFYTLKFAEKSRWMYAFEPVSTTFATLSRNLQRNQVTNATPFRVALSDAELELPINLYSSSGTNSLFWTLPDDQPVRLVGYETVRVTTLDDFVAREGLQPPGLIKLDVEGAELPALRGGRQLIARSRPVLVLESRDEPWFDPGYSRTALLDELFDQGYFVAGLSGRYDDFELHPLDEFQQAMVANIVAFPRQRRDLLEGFGATGAKVLRLL